MRWFTSDTHFGHKKAPAWRNLETVEEMDALLIHEWNLRIAPGDEVFHLGDFAFAGRSRVEDLLSKLNGRKELVRGNHDGRTTVRADGWAGWSYWRVVALSSGDRVQLMHDPAEAHATPGFVLHGHLHGLPDLHPFEKKPGVIYVDVGVDAGWGLAPVSESQIIAELKEH